MTSRHFLRTGSRRRTSDGVRPLPHDAPAAQITQENPAGTGGFAFVEYVHPNPAALHALFEMIGFEPVVRHRSKAITLYHQGDVDYLVNEESSAMLPTSSQFMGLTRLR
jgi:4-hydroxyphenylpyruvate dioxygenase-like putative hemolysin